MIRPTVGCVNVFRLDARTAAGLVPADLLALEAEGDGLRRKALEITRARLDADGLPAAFTPVVSTDGSYGEVGEPVSITDGSVTFHLPGDSVFTLTARP